MEPIRMKPVFQIINHLIFRQIRQRGLLTITENFPKSHAKCPNVALWWPESLQNKSGKSGSVFWHQKGPISANMRIEGESFDLWFIGNEMEHQSGNWFDNNDLLWSLVVFWGYESLKPVSKRVWNSSKLAKRGLNNTFILFSFQQTYTFLLQCAVDFFYFSVDLRIFKVENYDNVALFHAGHIIKLKFLFMPLNPLSPSNHHSLLNLRHNWIKAL